MMKYLCGFLMLILISCSSSKDSATASGEYIPWDELSNPVLSIENWAVKDACMVFKDSVFYVFAGAFYYEENGHFASHVVCFKTKDFTHFSEPVFIWDGYEDGWHGMASPNITKANNKYYLTYNSWGDKPGKKNQLFYAVSENLIDWEKDIPLANSITDTVRAIDAAVYFYNDKCFLVYKKHQTPQVAYADNIDSNDWTVLGDPGLNWFENGQLMEVDNKIMLFGTIRNPVHGPAISYLDGDPGNADEWADWKPFNSLNAEIPRESYNTHEQANAAFIADWRKYDGYFYMIGAGTTEGETFEGRGNCKLGLYRSSDLKHWEAPGN